MFFKIIFFPINYFFIGLVWIYKLLISPFKPKTCRFIPSCSTYMIKSIEEYSFIKGIFIGTKRLFRCNSKGKHGFDPIPINLKGDAKWLF